MYEINGKFGLVRLCRTNMSLRNTAAAAQPPFSFVGGGWHKCNSLYHFQRPHGVDNYLVFFP